MKKIALLLLGAALGFGFVVPAQAATGESFSNITTQWKKVTTNDQGAMTTGPAAWENTGGNPGGHLSSPVSQGKMRLYALQPPSGRRSYLGDLTGKTLSVDYKLDGTVSGPADDSKVRFFIGYTGGGQERYWVTNDAHSWAPGADSAWTTHQVQVQESNFQLWPNADKGDMTFAMVLKRYNDIGLVFGKDFQSRENLGIRGSGTVRIDNFGVVAAPGQKVPPKATVEKPPAPGPRKQPPAIPPTPPGGLMPGGGGFGMFFQVFAMFGSALFVISFGVSIFFYLLFCFFLYLIAKKTRVAYAWTAWVPFVNAYTMVAAADKPWWWLVLMALPLISLVPIVGLIGILGALVSLVVYILVWMAISERFSVNKWAGLLMLVPVIQWVYMGYLALRKESTPLGVSVKRVAVIAFLVFVVGMVALWALITFVLAPGLMGPAPTTMTFTPTS
mgnify:CR=1 FL=1